MTGSTKILTVSYGTFSCTLEGFDDPMGTMRDIAEYFRDLAADDRYFGAEPPTPDVDMLQNIAQRDARRRVEAQVGDHSVKLQVAAEAAEAEVVEDERSDEVSDRVAARIAAEAEPQETDADVSETGPLAFDDEYLLSDEPADVLAVDPEADIPQEEGPAESVAEKLRRIRAVVSKSIELESSEDKPPFSEDQAPNAMRERANTETLNQISADLAEDEELETEESVLEEDEPIAAAEENITHEIDHESDESEDTSEEDSWDIYEGDAGVESELDGEELEAELDEAFTEEDRELKQSVSTVLGSVLERTQEMTSEGDATEAEEPQDEEVGASPMPRPASRARTRPLSHAEEQQSVSRLLAEADTKLNEDDVQRRQRVISQMRAAVAATKADRILTKNPITKEEELAREEQPYRADLSAAVKPKEKPEAAPLVLVSEQRIDGPELEEASEFDPEGFRSFADDMGAKELPELLEAAAAYSAFVEGQSSFTRPEIMRRVAQYDPALQLTREDGLRSFGQLLRQGTFQKLERGQFVISDDTQYRPEHKIAGE